MRFYVDEDVDAEAARVLSRRGHDAWTTAEAGRSGARDPDQLVYAEAKNAVFVTHDNELVTSRLDVPMQPIIRLQCVKPHAADVIEVAIDHLVDVLERLEYVIIVVSETSTDELTAMVHHSTGPQRITIPR